MSKLKAAFFNTLVKAQRISLLRRTLLYAASRAQKLVNASTTQKMHNAEVMSRLSLSYPLSNYISEKKDSLYSYLQSFHFEDEPVKEMENYLNHAFIRFLYTLDLIPQGKGNLLEIGANPYFMTLLLDKYTDYHLTLTNHYGDVTSGGTLMDVKFGESGNKKEFVYKKVNLETDDLPYPEGYFDVALFCEVIEHLPQDSLIALQRIRKVLKQGGCLILTTPNVGRLENIVRMLRGENIYDPYSGYGIYGRHNREFTVNELSKLLHHAGFDIEQLFTSDVTSNDVFHYFPLNELAYRLQARKGTLGEYIFIRARNSNRPVSGLKPRWLYRSYPEDQLCD